MTATKALTVRLDPEDHQRLEAEAERLGLQPGTLARVYVRAGLAGTGETEAERKRRTALEALARLVQITADLPPVDAVQIARASREQLEKRHR